jgi:putative ATP-dependent endonuclease of OLD family
MTITYIEIQNFRGISDAHIKLNGHSVLIGDNNAGKSTVFEALDLVLGPERLYRIPVVDEHDFYNGVYYLPEGESPKIEIEVLITDLSSEQLSRFNNNIEFWDLQSQSLLPPGSVKKVDGEKIVYALRVKFIGSYNSDDDDFEGNTFYCSPEPESGVLSRFTKTDKRECGFLYLRALRTGSRALSMERGSLLDIILRIKEIRPKMWEDVLGQLRNTLVATDPSIGISEILEGVQESLKEFVPSDWGSEPILRVSDLTREHLRKTLTVFMSTGKDSYHAPFQHQGTGTINTMVLALLAMIADLKKNVIFAMEEPEIAIPPYTQKRIIDNIRKKSTQAIFTSHSPFVLEEFTPSQIILIQRDKNGVTSSQSVEFPSIIKPKNYNSEFRLRFSEALLAKKVLLCEGATEAISYPAAGRRLNELAASRYSSLEAMGIAVFDVRSETSIAVFGEYFMNLGKTVFAVSDKQSVAEAAKIKTCVHHHYQSPYKGFEDLLLAETDDDMLKEFYTELINEGEWPSHLDQATDDDDIDEIKLALKEYLRWNKGAQGAAELIGMCTASKQIPKSIRDAFKAIKLIIETS